MNKKQINTTKYEEYQNARVEGFIPAEWEFEDYLLAEVKRLNGIIDYIKDVGRIEKRKEVSVFFLSIMEKVLTLEEYEEWISECK